jgi:hypothetical protein
VATGDDCLTYPIIDSCEMASKAEPYFGCHANLAIFLSPLPTPWKGRSSLGG